MRKELVAEEFLNRVREDLSEGYRLAADKEAAFERAAKTVATMDAMPGGSDVGRRSEVYAITTEGISAKLDAIRRRRERAERLLLAMPNQTYASVLRQRYLFGKTWEDTAEAVRYSLDHTKGFLHRKALLAFCDVYFGKLNTP